MDTFVATVAKCVLLVLLAVAIFAAHSYLLLWLSDHAMPHGPKTLSRTVMLAQALFAGALVAIALAIPVLRIYRSWAVPVALLVVMPSALFRASYVSGTKLPFVSLTIALEAAALVLCLPAAVWCLQRLKLRSNNSFKPNTPRGGNLPR